MPTPRVAPSTLGVINMLCVMDFSSADDADGGASLETVELLTEDLLEAAGNADVGMHEMLAAAAKLKQKDPVAYRERRLHDTWSMLSRQRDSMKMPISSFLERVGQFMVNRVGGRGFKDTQNRVVIPRGVSFDLHPDDKPKTADLWGAACNPVDWNTLELKPNVVGLQVQTATKKGESKKWANCTEQSLVVTRIQPSFTKDQVKWMHPDAVQPTKIDLVGQMVWAPAVGHIALIFMPTGVYLGDYGAVEDEDEDSDEDDESSDGGGSGEDSDLEVERDGGAEAESEGERKKMFRGAAFRIEDIKAKYKRYTALTKFDVKDQRQFDDLVARLSSHGKRVGGHPAAGFVCILKWLPARA